MADKLLIYDDTCAYCRDFVRLVHFLDRRNEIVGLPFESPEAQALLRDQFGDKYGFAMYLFEGGQVSWGSEAARRISENVALSRWMGKFIFHAYPVLVNVVSKLTRRRRSVCEPGCAKGNRRSDALHPQVEEEVTEMAADQ